MEQGSGSLARVTPSHFKRKPLRRDHYGTVALDVYGESSHGRGYTSLGQTFFFVLLRFSSAELSVGVEISHKDCGLFRD